MATTRGRHTCPIYGIASELPRNQLPTVGDTMRCYEILKTNSPVNTKLNQIIHRAAVEVIKIWNNAGIPTVSLRRVEQKIESIHKSLKSDLKKKRELKINAISASKQESLYLFDVAACQCLDFNDCCCSRELKVPLLEREFLTDQRNNRQMIIGGLDKITTSKLIKKN